MTNKFAVRYIVRMPMTSAVRVAERHGCAVYRTEQGSEAEHINDRHTPEKPARRRNKIQPLLGQMSLPKPTIEAVGTLEQHYALYAEFCLGIEKPRAYYFVSARGGRRGHYVSFYGEPVTEPDPVPKVDRTPPVVKRLTGKERKIAKKKLLNAAI